MKLHVLLVLLGTLKTCALEKNDESEWKHRLTKRQTSEQLGPIPYTSRDQEAPLPYQHGQADSEASVTHVGNAGNAANRDYQGSYPNYGQSEPVEDWADSSDLGRTSFSSQIGGDNSPTFNNPTQQGSDSSPNGGGEGGGGGGGGRRYYEYQPPISSGRRVPTQTHDVAANTRYTFTQPVAGSVRSRSRTYSYPFSGGRAVGGSTLQGEGAAEAAAGGGGGDGGSAGSAAGQSLTGDEEPVVQVLPSEQPVVNPMTSRQRHRQLLRQRNLERQRLLEQRRRQQQQQQQQGGSASPDQQQPSGQRRTSGQQRPISTGSQQLGGTYGQQPYYTTRGRRPYYAGQRTLTYGGQSQPTYGGQSQPTYGGQSQPVYGGGSVQQPFYSYGYNQAGFDTSGYDSECPNTGIRIQINGVPCEQAVELYGSYLCYRHEYTSRECCLKCRGLKNPARVGCEYGDHSSRCQQLQSYDCYDLRNRQSCCHSCERLQKPGGRAGCEYGDMTPNCERVRQNPGLCYIPENRYLCCDTCSNIRVTDNADCPWGDQNTDLCQPFDSSGNIRINCYAPPIKRICCQSCERLKEWIPIDEPGCEYGDRPVTFNTGTHRNLNCTSFMRFYGYEQCTQNQAVATNCCYTCHRYTQG